MNIDTSISMFSNASKYIPGGVNSPVRAFNSVGGNPIFMKSAKGAYLIDVDGNQYIDFINSWGPMILGHNHPDVQDALITQAKKAFTFGTPTEIEIQIAQLISEKVPNVDKIRMTNSGTEACMSALRLARGYTGKNKFIKFEGNYHGHADPFLVKAGSGVAALGIQSSSGVTKGAAGDTIIAEYNNLEALTNLFEQYSGELAAIILEPVAGNMGCIPPTEGFLEGIRKLCDLHQVVLIFDEVMTGFRLAFGGAQEKYGIDADLMCYGKIIGGGLPVGAFAGKKEIMDCLAPLGSVYQAGTLSGNPLAMAAGYATLNILYHSKDLYNSLEQKTTYLKNQLTDIFNKKGIPTALNQVGSMFSLHFTDNEVKNYQDTSNAENKVYNKFFHHMLQNGIYLPPSAFETWFISDALSDNDIELTINTANLF